MNIATETSGNVSLDQGILTNKDHTSKCETHFNYHASVKNIADCMERSDYDEGGGVYFRMGLPLRLHGKK